MQTAKPILAGCLSALVLLCFAAFGRAEQLDSGTDSTLLSFQRSLAGVWSPAVGVTSAAHATQRGTPASDLIRGNGSRIGYALSHGGIVPNTEVVSVDGITQHPGRDYYLDNESGMLSFAVPIRPHQSIRVSYRYVAELDANRKAVNGPAFSFNIGSNNRMGIVYAYQAGTALSGRTSFDILTYGLNVTSTLGKSSSMSNMLFFSSPKESGRVSIDRLGQKNEPSTAQKPASDSIFIHNSELKFGKLSLKPTFQEVGKDFAGFSALRQQGGMAEEVVSRLEKEKGLTRLNLQVDYGNSMALGFSEIKEGAEKITKQAFSLSGPTVRVAGSIQEISEGFTRFNDLAETERTQWAKEKGLKRANISVEFAPSRSLPRDSAWNSVGMRRISDKTGDVFLENLGLALKGLSVFATRTKIDPGFLRLADLTENDRNEMALRIRQQFDPKAVASSLTPEDKQYALKDVGFDRSNIRIAAQAGDLSAVLSLLSIRDSAGGLTRRSLSLASKSCSITGFVQAIDKEFNRIAVLAPVEKANFGNEYGMRRTNLAGEVSLNPRLRLRSSFSQVKSEEGGVKRYGVNLTGGNFWLRGDFRQIDPGFKRVMDLADVDRQQLVTEQGFKRWDVIGHFESAKKFTLDSSFLDMKHAFDGRFRRRLVSTLVLTPVGDSRLTLFRDEDTKNLGGPLSKSLRQMFRLDDQVGSLSFNAIYDTTATSQLVGGESRTETRALHFNTLPGRATTLVGDWRSIQRSDGTFEDTQVFKMDAPLSNTLKLKAVRSEVRTQSTDALVQEYSLSGKISPTLNVAAKFGESLSNGNTIGKTRELSLAPDTPKDFGPFKSAMCSVAFGEVCKDGKVETQTKSLRFNANVLKHQLAAEYLGQVTKDGQTPIIRSFSLLSQQDQAQWVRYSISYKVRDPGAGPSLLIRRYSADARLGDRTTLQYNYFTCRELPNGVLEPVGGEHARLSSKLTKELDVVGDYDLIENYAKGTSKRTISLGLAGRVSALEALEVSYGYERLETSAGKSSARTYRLKYDYQVTPEHFLTITGQYTDWSGAQPAGTPSDDVNIMLDFRTVWS